MVACTVDCLHLYLITAAGTSKLFSMYTPKEMEWLSTESIAINNHKHGISPRVSIKSFT